MGSYGAKCEDFSERRSPDRPVSEVESQRADQEIGAPSASVVQGFNARIASGKSLPGPPSDGGEGVLLVAALPRCDFIQLAATFTLDRALHQPEGCTPHPARASFSAVAMNKRALIKKILAQLTAELEVYFRAAHASHAEATDEQNKAESKYDTRGLEASYLARGQSRQAMEMEAAIATFNRLEARKFGAGDAIDLGALVELEQKGVRTLYFIGPKAGGTEVVHEGREILVVTPQSPLGEQLLGKKQGDRLQLTLAGVRDQYRVVSVE
jgi:transcription elongation GreA/GreB family factor